MLNTLTARSPLRYAGGKSRAVKIITEYIPKDITCLCSPFLGGGSVELFYASQSVPVFAYDVFTPLVDFWQVLLSSPDQLASQVRTLHPLSRSEFYSLQKSCVSTVDKVERAAIFFALNRASFSGTTLSGGMSPDHPRFNEASIERLQHFNNANITVMEADFTVSMARHPNTFLYLDPPYANGGLLYGHKGSCHAQFDHEGLASLLYKRDNWLLSYNDCLLIRDLYANYTILTPEWSYGMNTGKRSAELLILSNR